MKNGYGKSIGYWLDKLTKAKEVLRLLTLYFLYYNNRLDWLECVSYEIFENGAIFDFLNKRDIAI